MLETVALVLLVVGWFAFTILGNTWWLDRQEAKGKDVGGYQA